MGKFITIIAILFIHTFAALSQELRLVVSGQPLNNVLKSLPIEISFDDEALSKYIIDTKITFNTAEEALMHLLKDKPLTVEKINGVYVISPRKSKGEPAEKGIKEEKKYHHISGIISDRVTDERLPYCYISLDKGTISSNESGFFTLKKDDNRPSEVKIQCLGYQVLDTLLTPGTHSIKLIPKTFEMEEVVIHSSPPSMLIQSGKRSGEIRVNHQVAQYIPGSVDNSVFNLLRMMPGVRASGEPSQDLIVWGSNMGESQTTFDGFTLFGLKSHNDQIGSINPYLVKDIRLSKGGFSASKGNYTGSIAEITGIDGNFDSPTVKANVSNYTINAFTSIPLSKRLNISAAYRQTFYELYNSDNANLSKGSDHGNGNNNSNLSNIYIEPDYDFRDANLKLSGKAGKNDSYYISLYGADDHFDFSVKQRNNYEVKAEEKSRQFGGTSSYQRIWENGSVSNASVSFSRLTANIDNLTYINGQKGNVPDINHTDNSVQELSVKLNHTFQLGERNQLSAGGEWQQYIVKINQIKNKLNKPSIYINDVITLNKLSLEAGIRADLLTDKTNIQPRLAAQYTITDELTATASFGLYHQYLTRTPYQYSEEGYQIIWNLADSTYTKSTHTIAGVAYSKNGFLISLEGYYKRYKNGFYVSENTIFNVDNDVLGADLFLKKELKKHTFYASYSLLNLKEPDNELSHEVKAGAIVSFKPFHFSASYVFGTGFSHISTGGHGHGGHQEQHGTGNGHQDDEKENYSRFDVSAIYKQKFKRFNLQTGVSILNVFDTDNIKYNYQLSNENNVTNIFTKATPFTPTVFIEIIF